MVEQTVVDGRGDGFGKLAPLNNQKSMALQSIHQCLDLTPMPLSNPGGWEHRIGPSPRNRPSKPEWFLAGEKEPEADARNSDSCTRFCRRGAKKQRFPSVFISAFSAPLAPLRQTLWKAQRTRCEKCELEFNDEVPLPAEGGHHLLGVAAGRG